MGHRETSMTERLLTEMRNMLSKPVEVESKSSNYRNRDSAGHVPDSNNRNMDEYRMAVKKVEAELTCI